MSEPGNARTIRSSSINCRECFRPQIRAYKVEENRELPVISEEKRINAIDYDPKQEMVFWADTYDNTIKRSYMIDAQKGAVKTGYPQDLNIRGKFSEAVSDA